MKLNERQKYIDIITKLLGKLSTDNLKRAAAIIAHYYIRE